MCWVEGVKRRVWRRSWKGSSKSGRKGSSKSGRKGSSKSGGVRGVVVRKEGREGELK